MAENYVCDGAKIECQLCTKPEGILTVTSNEVLLQDKPFATEADMTKQNLVFDGNCKKSPYQSYSCQAMIVVQPWQNTAEVQIQDQMALLESSTIMCMYGGVEIKITDHIQVAELTEIVPSSVDGIAPDDKKILDIKWYNKDLSENISKTLSDEKVSLWVKTQNYEAGESISITVKEQKENEIQKGVKEIVLQGKVDEKGEAILQELVQIDDIKKRIPRTLLPDGFIVENK